MITDPTAGLIEYLNPELEISGVEILWPVQGTLLHVQQAEK